MADLVAARPAGGGRGIPWGRIAGYAAMVLAVIVVGTPLFWMLSGSLKTTQEVFSYPPTWFPSHPRWENYVDAWHAAPFGRFYINSLIIMTVGTAIKMVNAVCTAYALVFLRFPAKNLIFIIILAGLMVPEQVTILPNYITLSDVFGQSWINTYQGIILPGAAIAFGTFLLRQTFLGLPREVIEAARLDGCNHLRLLWDMVIPMARSSVITVMLLVAVAKWNEYLWPLIITTTEEMRPLTVGLTYLVNRESNTQWGQVMAATVFVIVPLLVVFAFAQRLIIEGVTAGATKG
ncbi:MAG: carbohydrate ABC transporter permease [Thermomicrobiales bacterium]|nr:carbohydrate ABC transporter permease [Thermomicrobiales bacterium]